VCSALCALALLACDADQVGPIDNPVPILDAASPSLLLKGPPTVAVDVYGLGFVEGSEVRWNGAGRPTVFVDATHLTVTLADADLVGASGEVTVSSPSPGGGVSGAVTLTIGHPAPSVTDMTPTSATAIVTTEVTLVVNGSDFVDPGAKVLWDGAPLATTIVSSTQLQATVPDYLLRQGRTAAVSVANPSPGGGQSAALSFDVQNPVPSLTSTDPTGVTAGEDTEVDLLGTGFVVGSTAWLDGNQLLTTYVADTLLTVVVPAPLAVGGQTPSVSVENPTPGGGTSGALSLVVYVSPPVINAIYPATVFAGAADFTLIISGSNFDPAAQVTWDGAPRSVTFVTSSRLEIDVAASDVAAPGTVTIGVVNPAVGGTAYADLQILDALPSGSAILSSLTGGTGLIVSDLTGKELVSQAVYDVYQVDASPIGSNGVYFRSSYIYEMDPYTGTERRVTTNNLEQQWPRYTADGAWVYFMENNGRWEIWKAPAAGGAQQLVLSSTSGSYGYPTPSHAGDRLVFTKGVSSGASTLWVHDLTTGADTPVGVYGATSRWTPDDQWIIYWDWYQLHAVRPDGTGDFLIAPGLYTAPGFDISPDGSHIIAADYTKGLLISFPDGVVQDLPDLGAVRSTAFYGP